MVEKINNAFFTIWPVSVFYGLLVIPVELFVFIKSNSTGFIPMVLMISQSCGLIMIMVAIFESIVFWWLKVFNRVKPNLLNTTLQRAIMIGSGIFVPLFFVLFDKFYNKFAVLVVLEIIGTICALIITIVAFILMKSRFGSRRLTFLRPILLIIITITIAILTGISFSVDGSKMAAKDQGRISSSINSRPNILLIAMDTVRADHLSLYGYPKETTPFLKKMAQESAVFGNAYTTSPWTLPAHASLFTGLYPSQHNTHAEHFWLDDFYLTLAEMLNDAGYQTVCFSNNDYISSYHNLVQGFDDCWYKGDWIDNRKVVAKGLGKSIISTFSWFWNLFQIHIMERVIKNPASIWDYPTAAVTNKAILEWLNYGYDRSKPFFIFVNYMDAHAPYNPDEETARLFMNEKDLSSSYRKELRFPPVEYCLDLSKGGYTENDISVINALYDADIRYLDGELERFFDKFKNIGFYDETMIIITSDHGEYLGTRNRLAHGLGLHNEVLHVPLIIRYPSLFMPGSSYDDIVTIIDITGTILSFAGIKDRPAGMIETRVLFDLKENSYRSIFSEFRFPLHLLINSSLRNDNSKLFVEQKAIYNKTHKLIWKSRGNPEFYNLLSDPLETNNIYSKDNEKAKTMEEQLADWFDSICNVPPVITEGINIKRKDALELIDRLRAIGYIGCAPSS